jgi:hypothetical protein
LKRPSYLHLPRCGCSERLERLAQLAAVPAQLGQGQVLGEIGMRWKEHKENVSVTINGAVARWNRDRM